MQIEQVKPDKPSFMAVVVLFAVTILVIFIVAAIVVTVRSHSKEKTPFSKHPTAQISLPASRALAS